ncbi:hypothetical protein BRADI_3g02024v3 [Brachypodium distachyon]|uniref:Uncharacterized protein n=1 Tax=Brachypodium distachyon TaxID=15368 RepID=A0A2K2CUQ9_BRADI|nr:hypothetical protein BRADI_3g02024v3 [Brachypodium distachyon]PNT65755.1 hypothetical protein BRADI_3g02024v3 [Brachypodium distachyon]
MLRHPRLVAAFYSVFVETPPYRAPPLAYPLQVSIVPLVAAFYVVSAETPHTRRLAWHTLHQLGIGTPPLMAAFYAVSAETPPNRASILAHSSTTCSTSSPVATFYVVSVETLPYRRPLGCFLHQILTRSLAPQIASTSSSSTSSLLPHPHCRWHSDIQASSPTPTKHR